MAIVHTAIFDVVNAIAGHYQSYTGLPPAPRGTSMKAAIAQAAHDTLVALFASQTASFAARLEEDLGGVRDAVAEGNGIDLGHQAAAAILALRADDGSEHAEPRVGIDFITSDEPGKWRQDPISQLPLALGAYWGEEESARFAAAGEAPRCGRRIPSARPAGRHRRERAPSAATPARSRHGA